ncbi:hypothetical protein C7S16_6930 [Burkholderia thailandensis]|uniref:Uncharacterized protein n=1 Tax=Burkholderia thailandensis TaxID=57975 RepID=A0AAW9CS95_BURTH|nr:hypothetical protein [Burkholderia thailandensis]MDW9251494.1 hypothetical protein [Burkholderia thailandensis]
MPRRSRSFRADRADGLTQCGNARRRPTAESPLTHVNCAPAFAIYSEQREVDWIMPE